MAPLPTMRPVISMTLSSLRQTTSSTTATVTSTARAFSTTPSLATKTVPPTRLPSKLIPPYPYGERLVYKQSNTGLYGSARIRFGNTVSARHNKARRTWKPNLHVKIFHLPEVGANVKVKLTMRVLKTIQSEGGLQNYLLKDKPQRVKELGPGGWNLRWLLMQSRAVQERLNAERRSMGLEEREVVDRDDVIHYALDYATPGPLSLKAQSTLADLKAGSDVAFEGFTLGFSEAEQLAFDEVVRTVEPELENETKVKAEKDGVRDL